MRAYLVRRLLLLIPTMFILTAIVFLAVRFIPGDIVDIIADSMWWEGDEGVDQEALRRMLGLDVPVHVQYGRWMGDILLRGSFGESLFGGWPIGERIAGRLPVSIQLGVMAIVIGLVIALPVGIYSAIRQDTAADYVGRTAAVIGMATPNFWLGMMVMLYPAVWWGWSPPVELITFKQDPLGNLGMFFIPALILGTAMSAATMRMTRTMMLEVLRQDYIRTTLENRSRAKVHVLRAIAHDYGRDYTNSISELENAQALTPDDGKIDKLLELAQAKQFADAEKRAQPRVTEGARLLKARRLEDAEAVFRSVLEFHPASTVARYSLATIHYARGEHVQATEELLKVLEIDPGSVDARYSLAIVRGKLGEHAQAELSVAGGSATCA